MPRAFPLAPPPAWLALNRAEDLAELALCFVSLPPGSPDWIELVPGGDVVGADGRTWINDRPQDFVAQSARLKRIAAGWCVDFDHQLQLAANEKVGGTAPAAGWITQLEVRDGAIWGKVEWTDLGQPAIANKRYRGISPVFAYDKATKRVIGLVSAALTNNPNLDLVALNAVQPEKPSMPAWLKQLLNLSDTATEEQAKTALNSYIALVGAVATAIGVDAKAALALNAESLKGALVKQFGTSDVLVAVCARAGLKTDAGADAIVTALQKPDASKFVPIEAHNALKVELDAIRLVEQTKLVDQALKDGRLLPAQKDWALNYVKSDPKGFEAYLAKTPEKLGGVTPPAGGTLDVNDARAVAANAQKYIAEQSALGIVVSTTAAVAHVTKGAK